MQKMIIGWLALWFFLVMGESSPQAKPWKTIVPLKSTRSDVEQLLGKPNKYNRYEINGEQIYINYVSGTCGQKKNCECLAPKDTVLDIYIVVGGSLKLSELGVSKNRLKRQAKGHASDLTSYADDIEGASYTVNDKSEDIVTMTFFASAKDCQRIISTRPKQ